MKIVHLGSKVITTFAVLHDSEDVTDSNEFVFPLPALTASTFEALLPRIESKRTDMLKHAQSVYEPDEPAAEKEPE